MSATQVVSSSTAMSSLPNGQSNLADNLLSTDGLTVDVDGTEILHGVTLRLRPGEVVALMGPNGSGKSTLAHALMGHPRYRVTGGAAVFAGKNLLECSPDERARLGLFLSFQYPQEVSGVPLGKFLRSAHRAVSGHDTPVREFFEKLSSALSLLKMDESFIERSLNEGFSGGEKKRAEILQLAVLEPRLAILDETDSGLDIDALRVVADGLRVVRERRPDIAVLLITHYERFLEFLRPDRVIIMKEGSIIAEGGKDLADRIQREGYDTI